MLLTSSKFGFSIAQTLVNIDSTTDSAGAFHIDSLPAGEQIIQLRELGYTAKRDVIELAEGKEVLRDFVLQPVASLAAMSATARKYNIPAFAASRIAGSSTRPASSSPTARCASTTRRALRTSSQAESPE